MLEVGETLALGVRAHGAVVSMVCHRYLKHSPLFQEKWDKRTLCPAEKTKGSAVSSSIQALHGMIRTVASWIPGSGRGFSITRPMKKLKIRRQKQSASSRTMIPTTTSPCIIPNTGISRCIARQMKEMRRCEGAYRASQRH